LTALHFAACPSDPDTPDRRDVTAQYPRRHTTDLARTAIVARLELSAPPRDLFG
jgi:hypothetical protein